jgi:pentatricopeptide repeat protein
MKEAIQPNSFTYTTIFDAYAKQGRLDSVLHFWNEMEMRNITPDVSTFVSYYYGRRRDRIGDSNTISSTRSV